LCCVVLAVFLLSGCAPKKEVQEHTAYWQQYQARLYDIPIAVYAQPIKEYCITCADSDQAIQLGYQTSLSSQSVAQFYAQEMERLGWFAYGAVAGKEQVMQFEKPRRFCIVSVRSSGPSTIVVVSVGFKR